MSEEQLTKPSDGFFLAKSQVQESLQGRIDILNDKLEACRKEENYTGLALVLIEIEILEKTRTHFRNSLLWDTSRGA